MENLTLKDDIISSFKYDMINGNLEGFKIAGGNYIKISQLPIKTRVYWNSRYDKNSAKLLNESNRGARILQYSESGVPLTYQNYYIWTEADLSDVDTWLDWQRELVIEVSGLGGEVTYDVANPASEIRVESLQQISVIRELQNLGSGSDRVEAGIWAKNMLEKATNNEVNTRNLTTINNSILSLKDENNTGLGAINDSLQTLQDIEVRLANIDSKAVDSNDNQQEMINQNNSIKEAILQGNVNTLNTAGLTSQVKNLLVTTNDTLNAIDTKISDFKTSSDEKLDNISQEATLQEANTNLSSINNKIQEANNNLTTINDNVTTSNEKLEAIDTQARLLNLEATQQEILTQLQTANIQLNNINSSLQGGTGGEYIPSDLVLNVEAYPYYTNGNTATNLQKISQYTKKVDLWQSPNKKITFRRDINATTLNIPAISQEKSVFTFETNYLVKLKLTLEIAYQFERGNLAQPTFNDEQYRFITAVMGSCSWVEITTGTANTANYNAPNLTKYIMGGGLVALTQYNRANNPTCYQTIYAEYETSGFNGDVYTLDIYSNHIDCSIPYVTLPAGITPNNIGNFINIYNISGNIEVARVIKPNVNRTTRDSHNADMLAME